MSLRKNVAPPITASFTSRLCCQMSLESKRHPAAIIKCVHLRYSVYICACVSLQWVWMCMLCVCVCVTATQVIVPLLLCRKVALLLPWSQQRCREHHSREESPIWNKSLLYSDWWAPSGTTRLCFSVSHAGDSSQFGREKYGCSPNLLWHSEDVCSACRKSAGLSVLFLARWSFMGI